MLTNFMHLVTAVKLGTARRVTRDSISAYELHMHRYLTGILELYPNTEISPYQHLALHFGPMLKRFGPSHTWRCFPFERYNYLLQKIPTNSRFGKIPTPKPIKQLNNNLTLGDLEKTMFNRFCMGQNLRSLFCTQQIPPEIHSIIPEYDRTFHADIRGTFLTDDLAFDDTFQKLDEEITWAPTDQLRLPKAVYKLLQQWCANHDGSDNIGFIPPSAFLRRKVVRLGQTFQTSSISHGDSKIIYKTEASHTGWAAGDIQEIFSHTRVDSKDKKHTSTFFVVDEYAALSAEHGHHDHYSTYQFIGCRLFYRHDLTKRVLVPIDDVSSHFASLPWLMEDSELQEACILAYPLER